MPRVLIAGFERFSSIDINPSEQIAQKLDGEMIDGYAIKGVSLPCSFSSAYRKLATEIALYQPQAIIATGLAANRSSISIERIAVNYIDAPIPDNDGEQPVDCLVLHSAPVAYFSSLPVIKIHDSLRVAGIESEISMTAGTYVCNALFFAMMHQLNCGGNRDHCAGFIHVPPLPGQFSDGRFAMDLDIQVMAIRTAISSVAVHIDSFSNEITTIRKTGKGFIS